MNSPRVDFQLCDPAEAPASHLLDAMVAELHTMYSAVDGVIGVPLHPDELAPPGGRYLVGRIGAEALAGGGIRTLDGSTGEIKRMYVVPAWRGRGLARLLLSALESEAVAMKMDRVRLDTGPKQAAARHLYLSAGYVEIENYNSNPHASFWGEKLLGR